ncbi:multidrug efflux pump subunit AcrA (membrane-fusion protein) [Chryseobacterium sp. SORGH_AS909]|uniref:HlyD family secretion protein n=1 Tax=unclassified Chryseobacterium TaxID=2593645 RepID=UPI0027883FCE|nr:MULTISPECIES: HlyD family efflux transporter periplasmic adaptor subunit [unclassified Chryseobacterium]MDQ1102701.1 multidrug efflux pump subunit AcrA (membrane-fusion protein) [Chryseobacterium sp. SORGH_AS_1048]MDR6086130.1 multidrug efflux pump subunit AcrA (membrane-fusion protein) [Chryseobacterium sp. SORGH_AS_0909]MDR6130500.1 multidrug efflux pump subunit AcrA (membrane-fusion protein) [Chryseobacterium sp. SORGH_AS_1175]MDT3407373.1 multidrug efflux pump subunit AcrA (membrane-fusi
MEKDTLDSIELRSESVQDILTQPPHWMIRWGNTIILIILVMVLIMSYLIKYPEFVPAPIVVTSQNPPEKLEARTNSKIEKIFIKNHKEVHKNEILMVMQSTANYKDVLALKKIVDSISPSQLQSFPLNETSHFKLGELQGDYNSFAKAFQDEALFTRLQPYAPENLAANQSISEYRARIATLQQQKKLEQAKYELTRKSYQRSQDLFNQGVISAVELENEKIKFIQEQQNLENINISLSQMEEGISNLNKTKSGTAISTEKDKITYSSQTLQLFEQLRKTLKQWEQNYLIVSSTDGVASFQQFFGENQFVKTGDVILTILPKNKEQLVGRMSVPSVNSGKVTTGEKVLIKLDNYRFQEYGIIEGRVQNISMSPDDKGNYYVDVTLPKGLRTSYNKTLPFDKELRGNAEIVTQDLRLIERFFYQMRKLLGYQS